MFQNLVAEWLGRRTTRGSWVRILAKAQRGIFEQDTLKSTARGSHNKQKLLAAPLSKKNKKKNILTK
jgi:hypothetical protein